jgi:hypothetical protein
MELFQRRIFRPKDNSCTMSILTGTGTTFSALEDGHHEPKIPKQTCIPAGRYRIRLRTESPMAASYKAKYGPQHKGMLWLRGVPNFTYVYIHVGNDEDDTDGCPIIGTASDFNEGFVGGSVAAYKRFYPVVMAALEDREEVWLTITDELGDEA